MCSQISSYWRMPFSQGCIMGKERRVFLWGVGWWYCQMCSVPGSLPEGYEDKGASQSLDCIRRGGEKQSKRGDVETSAKREGKGSSVQDSWLTEFTAARQCCSSGSDDQSTNLSPTPFPTGWGCLSVTTSSLLTPEDWAEVGTMLGAVRAGGKGIGESQN